MTNEKILEMLYAALKAYPANELTADDCLNAVRMYNGKPDKSGVSGIFSAGNIKIAELIYMLEAENRKKATKKAGKADLLAVAKKIMKNTYKEELKTAFTNDEYQVITDGYRALLLTGEKKLDIETKEKQVCNIKKCIPVETSYTATLPAAADLKVEITKLKAMYGKNHGLPIVLESADGKYIAFNPEFLLDMIKSVRAFCVNFEAPNRTAEFCSNDIIGLLCPIRVKDPNNYTGLKCDKDGNISFVENASIIKAA